MIADLGRRVVVATQRGRGLSGRDPKVERYSPGVYVADMAAQDDQGVIGRWADKWESSPDAKTWTFHLRPGIKSWTGNEMTSADMVWTWQRAFEMKSARYFFATVMDLKKPDDIEVMGHLHLVAAQLANTLGLQDGYRIVVNCKERAGQTVPHLHMHLLGGRDLSWPPG